MTLITPNTPEYTLACQAASEILGVTVRYLGEYPHGPTSIGLAIKRGTKLEIQLRRNIGPGATGGYLRDTEFALQALGREHKEEEMPQGTALTIDVLYASASVMGMHDSVGHTVANQRGLREWGLFLLINPEVHPELTSLSFTPTKEAESKLLVDSGWIRANREKFRKHEYNLLLRAALAAEGKVSLPKLTRDPEDPEGFFLDMVDNRETAF